MSRIMDKCICNVCSLCTAQVKAGSIYMSKQANSYGIQVPRMWDTTDSRAAEMLSNSPKHLLFWPNFVITCTKTRRSERLSMEELRIYFNGKQLHSFVIWYFFPLLSFWEHAFWIFNSSFVKASVTHIIEKMFVQWHAWEYSYLILMIKPRGQKNHK